MLEVLPKLNFTNITQNVVYSAINSNIDIDTYSSI